MPPICGLRIEMLYQSFLTSHERQQEMEWERGQAMTELERELLIGVG
jgi:hypothetical protein